MVLLSMFCYQVAKRLNVIVVILHSIRITSTEYLLFILYIRVYDIINMIDQIIFSFYLQESYEVYP